VSPELRVAVPAWLLELAPVGGHGKVWHRVLAELSRSVTLVPFDRAGRSARSAFRRRADVVLTDGHADLPDTSLPIVVQVHEAGWFSPELRAVIDREFLDYIAPRTERALKAADHVITPSQAARHDLIEAYALDPACVHAVHHGVDAPFRTGVTGGSVIVGAGDRPYVLYVATLHPRKNLAALRDAMAELVADGLPHVLAIAGHAAPDRRDSSALERAAAAELESAPGRVVRLAHATDTELAALMAGTDAFCLPSLYEGFGLTALEAMACGAPVVVSDRGALPEVVGDAGVVTAPTAAAVRDALHRILTDDDLAERLRQAGPARAATFTWKRAAAGWLAVLRRAARRM
jgi:glycosyltransferase involved in cell wall biosynthesis